MRWIALLFVSISTIISMPAQSQQAGSSTIAAIDADPDRVEAARALTRVLFRDEDKVVPPPDSKAGDEKDPMGFKALGSMQDKWAKMYTPVSPEAARRRDDIVARFLARQFSAPEMSEIAAFLERNLLEKMEDALMAAAQTTLGKCGFNPTFDIPTPPPLDPEKRALIHKLADVRDATGSSLPILACQDVLVEQAWSQMAVEELRAVVAFNESAAGMKWAALRSRLRQ
jgi:hypothetical protein